VKILLLSDEESPLLWDHFDPSRLEGGELILSAGDLKPEYLRFLVTMTNRPLLYVHGNHDGRYGSDPPEGCRCIEDSLVTVGGLRILGLGGSMKYSDGPHQYTEAKMAKRVQLARIRARLTGPPDLILTHAPLRGVGDQDSLPHRGFQCFHPLLEDLRPRYFVHGHIHKRYVPDFRRVRLLHGTEIINACGFYLLDTDRTP